MERVVKRLFAVLLIGLLAGSLAACYTLLKHPSTEAGDDSNADPCVDCPSYYASPYILWPALPLIDPLPPPPSGGRDRETQSGPPARSIDPKEPRDRKTPSKESTGTGDPKEKRRD
jgi:hypothetical protein